jgi:hypothetical protein
MMPLFPPPLFANEICSFQLYIEGALVFKFTLGLQNPKNDPNATLTQRRGVTLETSFVSLTKSTWIVPARFDT